MVRKTWPLLLLSGTANAAQCFDDQKRTTETPSGEQIKNAITPGIEQGVCNSWRFGDEEQVTNTFNHGCKFSLNPQPAEL